jgi:hypothetical protein
MVAALTAPNGYPLPIKHPEETVGRILQIKEKIFGTETTDLRKRLIGMPAQAEEIAKGVLWWTDNLGDEDTVTDQVNQYHYKDVIFQILPLVDDETADRLFPILELNEETPIDDTYYEANYTMITRVLRDEQMPQRFKDAALGKWFKVIEFEEQGGRRVGQIPAIDTLALNVQTWTSGEHADDELNTVMVKILENRAGPGETYINGLFVTNVAEHVTDEDLRFEFVWRHLNAANLSPINKFRIETVKDYALVQWLRAMAADRGRQGFDAKAKVLFDEYEERQEAKQVAADAEQALLAEMQA